MGGAGVSPVGDELDLEVKSLLVPRLYWREEAFFLFLILKAHRTLKKLPLCLIFRA